MDLNRALRQSIVSVELGSGRERRIAESERVLKAVAKQLARQAGDLVDDRRSREAIRISVYNALTPVLLEMRDRVEGRCPSRGERWLRVPSSWRHCGGHLLI